MVERCFWFFGEVAVPAGQVRFAQEIQIRGVGDFFARAIGFGALANIDSGFSFRCKYGDGFRYFQSGFVPQTNLTLFDPSLMPLAPELLYRLNDSFVFDVRSELGEDDTAFVVLQGVNRLSALSARPYPARKYKESSYRLGCEVNITAGERLYSQEIRLPMRDLPFVIRMLHWNLDPVASTDLDPVSLRVRLHDEEHQLFTNEFIPVDFLFRRGGDGHRPGTPYPEILVPAGRAAYFDIECDAREAAAVVAPAVAYPTLLTILANVPPEQQTFGPFNINDTRFVFGFRETDGLITVARSTDAGVTWLECDAGNALTRDMSFPMFTVVPDGNFAVNGIVHVVRLSAAGFFTYTPFDCTAAAGTGAWGADTASALGYTAGPPSPNTNDNAPFVTYRETDDNLVLFVSSVLEALPALRWRCQFATFDIPTLTWSGYTQVGTVGGDNVNYYSNACVRGDGFTHFFYRFVPFNAAIPIELRHTSLSDAGALSADQTITSGVQAVNPFRRSSAAFSRSVLGGIEVCLPIRIQNTPDYFLTFISGISVALPVWTLTTIATGARKQLGMAGDEAQPLCVFDDNGLLCALWGFTSFDAGGNALSAELRISTSLDGLTWGAATVFYLFPGPGFSVSPSNIGGRQIASFGFMAVFDDGFTPILDYWESSAVPPAGVWRVMLVFSGAVLNVEGS